MTLKKLALQWSALHWKNFQMGQKMSPLQLMTLLF